MELLRSQTFRFLDHLSVVSIVFPKHPGDLGGLVGIGGEHVTSFERSQNAETVASLQQRFAFLPKIFGLGFPARWARQFQVVFGHVGAAKFVRHRSDELVRFFFCTIIPQQS